jgi:hypothetical protein
MVQEQGLLTLTTTSYMKFKAGTCDDVQAGMVTAAFGISVKFARAKTRKLLRIIIWG